MLIGTASAGLSDDESTKERRPHHTGFLSGAGVWERLQLSSAMLSELAEASLILLEMRKPMVKGNPNEPVEGWLCTQQTGWLRIV